MPEATTGGTWKPRAYDFIIEAFERNGVKEEGRGTEEWRSALRSLQFLQTDFATKKMYLPTIQERSYTVPAGTPQADDESEIVLLEEDVIDIVSVAIKVNDSDIIMRQMSYEDYVRVPFKDTFRERSYIYLHEKTQPRQRLRLYYKPDQEYVLTAFVEVRPTDVNELSDPVQTSPRWHEAFCAGMAFRLAQKFSPERVQEMKILFDEAYAKAKKADNLNNPVKFTVGRIM